MIHEVLTASNGQLVAAQLPTFANAEGKVVRAAQIVAIGLPSVLGVRTSRLALGGGIHVDTPKRWVIDNKPSVGDYYVQTSDEAAEIILADVFEAGYGLVSADAAAGAAEQSAAQVDLGEKLNALVDAEKSGPSSAFDAAEAELKTALDNMPLPSAEDLDAFAQEQAAAEATAAPAEEGTGDAPTTAEASD